jgi:hypothetical protein
MAVCAVNQNDLPTVDDPVVQVGPYLLAYKQDLELSPKRNEEYVAELACELLNCAIDKLFVSFHEVIKKLPVVQPDGNVGPTPAYMIGRMRTEITTLAPGFALCIGKTAQEDGHLFFFWVENDPAFVEACGNKALFD